NIQKTVVFFVKNREKKERHKAALMLVHLKGLELCILIPIQRTSRKNLASFLARFGGAPERT
ncbi:MAG: hypothetical protein IJG16_12775, partial [Clostridia bacterium]|nr:hypothetical protein [Clostridia bacterium]